MSVSTIEEAIDFIENLRSPQTIEDCALLVWKAKGVLRNLNAARAVDANTAERMRKLERVVAACRGAHLPPCAERKAAFYDLDGDAPHAAVETRKLVEADDELSFAMLNNW